MDFARFLVLISFTPAADEIASQSPILALFVRARTFTFNQICKAVMVVMKKWIRTAPIIDSFGK